MKKIVFLSMIILLIIGSYAQERKSPIEGSWRLVSGKMVTQDTVYNYPVSVNGNHMKIIGEKYFSTIWQDTTINKSDLWYAGFNGGTYTFENGIYTETYMHFTFLSSIGNKFELKVEFKNDTLVLTNIPKGETDKNSMVEKWKRLE